jgi:hypothetical protein
MAVMNYDDDVRIVFSPKLLDIISKLEDTDDFIAYELSWMASKSSKYQNIMDISRLDVSNSAHNLEATIHGKKSYIKIGTFLRSYFPAQYDDMEISQFARNFASLLSKGVLDKSVKGNPIKHEDFKYNPKDPRSTFLSLVTKTYPYGHEDEVLKFLPDLEVDKVGNYYKIISGDDSTMFTSHLDTADRVQVPTNLFSKTEEGDEYIYTDGSSILGADDKSGVTVMLYMMAHNIPGLYYFFIGEERGGIGSHALAGIFDDVDYLKNIKRCVSFDRRKNCSVITHQMGRQCCSNEFATALCRDYNKNGLNLSMDTGGVYTDSASFIDDIPECTNISVGYNNEHTGREIQNMTYLIDLCKASIKIKWRDLPFARKVGFNQELLKKYKPLIASVKETVWDLDVKVVGIYDRLFIKIDLEDQDVSTIFDTLSSIESLMYRSKLTPDVIFNDSYIKIELK